MSSMDHASCLKSKESLAAAIVAWAKARIMRRSIDEKELERLFEAVRAAGNAEGYARAKFEMTPSGGTEPTTASNA